MVALDKMAFTSQSMLMQSFILKFQISWEGLNYIAALRTDYRLLLLSSWPMAGWSNSLQVVKVNFLFCQAMFHFMVQMCHKLPQDFFACVRFISCCGWNWALSISSLKRKSQEKTMNELSINLPKLWFDFSLIHISENRH